MNCWPINTIFLQLNSDFLVNSQNSVYLLYCFYIGEKLWFITMYFVFFFDWIARILSMYFHFSRIISPCIINRPFIWRNSNSLHPRMNAARLVEMGPMVLDKEMKIWSFQTDIRSAIRKPYNHLSVQVSLK